jgi:hypothetical protein
LRLRPAARTQSGATVGWPKPESRHTGVKAAMVVAKVAQHLRHHIGRTRRPPGLVALAARPAPALPPQVDPLLIAIIIQHQDLAGIWVELCGGTECGHRCMSQRCALLMSHALPADG